MSVRPAVCVVLGLERRVDLQERLTLSIGQRRVTGQSRRHRRIPLPRLEDSRTYVQGLRGDLKCLRNLRQYLGAGFAKTPFDLTEVGVGHPGSLGQLSQGQLRRRSLLADVFTHTRHVDPSHTSRVHTLCLQLQALSKRCALMRRRSHSQVSKHRGRHHLPDRASSPEHSRRHVLGDHRRPHAEGG